MPYENLSNIDDYQLISYVENSPELWQLNHPNYCNTSLKNQIWADIGNLMGFEASVCRNRWVNIRDNYRRSLKKSMTEVGHKKTYKFFDSLNFLKSSILEGPKGNFSYLHKTDFAEISPSDTKIENESDNERNIPSLESNQPSTSAKRTQSPMISQSATFPEKRFRRPDWKIENFQQRTAHYDAVDAFLAGLAPTLRSLTPYYLNLAKSKIFITVQKYEMHMLMDAQNREVEYEDPFELYRENEDSDTELPEKTLDTKENIIIVQDVPNSKS